VEIDYQRSNYRLAAKHALEALCKFESIDYVPVEDACKVLNEALLQLNLDDTCTISSSNIFSGRCSTEVKARYQELQDKSRPDLEAGRPSIDEHLLDLSSDKRRGISLILRPSEETRQLLARVQDHLRDVAPEQYFYDPLEYHVTVMTLITVKQSMEFSANQKGLLVKGLTSILQRHQPFQIQFKGIGFTRDCVMAYGFFRDGTLDEIRKDIREKAASLDLAGELEGRFPSILAHMTIIRFQSRNNLNNLVRKIDKLASCELGICHIDKLELVLNDWYMRKEKVQVLASFEL
jgi:2'-5' RNA ligase